MAAELNYSDWFQAKIKDIRIESGNIKTYSPLVEFLYFLMRDYLAVGHIEKIIEEMEWQRAQGQLGSNFTNGWLAQYASNVAHRIADLTPTLCEDEGCEHHGTPHICQTLNTTKDSPKSGKRTQRSTSKK